MEQTNSFYYTRAWQQCREAYKKSKGGLCERCLAKGIIKPGEIVHHKIHITPQNMNDTSVTLNWENLQLVCRDCHGLIHRPEKRYKVDAFGRVRIAPD